MQLIIEINQEQDLQFLLSLLERMRIVYKPVLIPSKREVNMPNRKAELAQSEGINPENVAPKPSDRLAGKLSSETAKALLAHIEESRNEWERNF